LNVVNGEDFHGSFRRADCQSALRLDRVPCLLPGCKTAQDGSDFGISVMQKEERRTGARVFIQSGTVGDDPVVLIKTQVGEVDFELA
jgi:hypothetical protein